MTLHVQVMAFRFTRGLAILSFVTIIFRATQKKLDNVLVFLEFGREFPQEPAGCEEVVFAFVLHVNHGVRIIVEDAFPQVFQSLLQV